MRREAARHQRIGAVELLLRERDLGLLLLDIGVRFVEGVPRRLDLRLGLVQRGLEILRVHARDDLAGLDHVALVGEHLGDAPGEFGVDVDLVGLDPAVARRDPQGQAALVHMLPIGRAPAGADDDESEQRPRFPSRPSARRRRTLARDGQRGRRGNQRRLVGREHVAVHDLRLARRGGRRRSFCFVAAHHRGLSDRA